MEVTIDTTRFEEMCEALAAEIHVPIDNIVREELGRVLSKTIENTDAADVSKIKNKSENARLSMQRASIYQPQRPSRRKLVQGNFVLYDLSHHYPDALWQAIQRSRAMDVAKRLKARGLAKQSWWLMGQKLGLTVDAPAYVKKAKATTGREYSEDEKVSQRVSSDEVSYTMDNYQPTVNAINGEEAIERAIDGRMGYFMENLRRGVFDNLERIALKYGGVMK
jgi:hypothetical protein